MKAPSARAPHRLIVAPIDQNERTEEGYTKVGGMGLVTVGAKAPDPIGLVLSVGPLVTGIQVGDVVVYRRDNEGSFTYGETRLSWVKEQDVICAIEQDVEWRMLMTQFQDGAWTMTVTFRPRVKALPAPSAAV